MADCLAGCWLLHCDSRHTAAAAACARRANAVGVLVSVDCEKDRLFLEDLLPCADVLFTNTAFPVQRCPEPDTAAAWGAFTTVDSFEEIQPRWIVSPVVDQTIFVAARGQARLLAAFPRAQLVVTTLGAHGAIATMRRMPVAGGIPVVDGAGCNFFLDVGTLCGLSGSQQEVLGLVTASWFIPSSTGEFVECAFVHVGAWPLGGGEAVVDTTGAGDAFIGGALHALRQGAPVAHALAAGAYVAGKKIQAQGARSNFPSATALHSAVGV
jgi:sugar/nucleoside kinase (ribokinase family)